MEECEAPEYSETADLVARGDDLAAEDLCGEFLCSGLVGRRAR